MTEQYIDLITGKPLEPWAQQAMQRQSVNDPVAPSPQMIAAGERALIGMSEKHWGRAEAVYRAMVSADPRVGKMEADLGAAKKAILAQEQIICAAQIILVGYLKPDGFDASATIDKLLALLDGPDQRAVHAQTRSTLSQIEGSGR